MVIGPSKSAHQALKAVQENSRKMDWVIDLDIKGFFDNIEHDKLMLALKKHVSEKWCLIYIERWLQMPILRKTGRTGCQRRERHTTGRSNQSIACKLILTLCHG